MSIRRIPALGSILLYAALLLLPGCEDGKDDGLPSTDSQKLEQKLAPVLQGQGVPQAAAYMPGPGVHKLVEIGNPPNTGCDGDNCISGIPDHWKTQSVGETELVLGCTYTEDPMSKTCEYNGGKTAKLSHVVAVYTLYAARTGEVIDQRTFEGDQKCPFSVFYHDSFPSTITDEIDFPRVYKWLKPYVEP